MLLIVLVFSTGLLLAACGDETSNSSANTTTSSPATIKVVTTQAAAATNTKTVTTQAATTTSTKAATTQPNNNTSFSYGKVLEATIQSKSYRSVANILGKDTTITTTYVAPDRISTVLTSSTGKSYTIYIGDTTYRSTDGVKWQKSIAKGNSITELFRSQKLPADTKFTPMPDTTLDGKTVGVFSYEVTNTTDPEYAGIGALKATIWYDKENLWILKQVGKSEAGDTEIIYSDYNSPANKIEVPN